MRRKLGAGDHKSITRAMEGLPRTSRRDHVRGKQGRGCISVEETLAHPSRQSVFLMFKLDTGQCNLEAGHWSEFRGISLMRTGSTGLPLVCADMRPGCRCIPRHLDYVCMQLFWPSSDRTRWGRPTRRERDSRGLIGGEVRRACPNSAERRYGGVLRFTKSSDAAK